MKYGIVDQVVKLFQDAEKKGEQQRLSGDLQRDLSGENDARQRVPAKLVRAEPVGDRRRQQTLAQIRFHRIARDDPGGEDGDDIKGNEDDAEDEADHERPLEE